MHTRQFDISSQPHAGKHTVAVNLNIELITTKGERTHGLVHVREDSLICRGQVPAGFGDYLASARVGTAGPPA